MKIGFTKFQKIMEAICAILVLSIILYTAIKWPSIPNKIPTYFNFRGEIEAYGSKNTIFFSLAMTIILYLFLTVVNFFPRIWNVTSCKKDPNRAYKLCRDMLINIKAVIVVNFSYITYCSINMTSMFIVPTLLFSILAIGMAIGYTVYILIKC